MRNIGTYSEPGDESVDPDDDNDHWNLGCGDDWCTVCGNGDDEDELDDELGFDPVLQDNG